MKQDKFLIGILAGILLLVIVAVVTVLLRVPSEEEYIADDTPEGLVHNYFLALQREDYEKAYSYLSDDLENKPSLTEFTRDMDSYGATSEASLQIGEVRPGEQQTTVEILLTRYRVGSIFENNSYTTESTALLTTNSAGQWRLLNFPQPYWGWAWDQPRD